MFEKSSIKKILIISLSNIGDVILTFPVIDFVLRDFSNAQVSVVVGPKAESLFLNNPLYQHVYIFDKHQAHLKTISWVSQMRQEHYDLVIDLRNTAIPFFISPRYRTSFIDTKKRNVHMKDKHLNRLKHVYAVEPSLMEGKALFISDEDASYVNAILKEHDLKKKTFVVIGPGAASHVKRWTETGFQDVADQLKKKYGLKIVLVGDKHDFVVAERISRQMNEPSLNLCSCLSLPQLGAVLSHAALAVLNDSGPMHLASYLNIPTVAIFGPTNPEQYGPWSAQSLMIRKNTNCLACQRRSRHDHHTCMESVSSEDVLCRIHFDHGQIRFT